MFSSIGSVSAMAAVYRAARRAEGKDHPRTARTTADLGTDFRTRIQGTCVKHYLGWAAIKMYESVHKKIDRNKFW